MKKSFISIALAGILAISFSGCVGSSTPINIYQTQKENITFKNWYLLEPMTINAICKEIGKDITIKKIIQVK